MSAAAAPPPPPPPDNISGKSGPGYNSQSNKDTSPASRNRGDGASAKTAFWSTTLWNNPNQTQYLVFRRTMQAPARWTRCTEGEARYDADAGFAVFRVEGPNARRVNLLAGETPRARGEAFFQHFREIEQEERDRVARYEPVGREEDLLEGIDEEYEDKDPSPFDEPLSPSRGDARRAGSGSFGDHPAASTPRRTTAGSTSSPLSSSNQLSSPRGTASGSSPRDAAASSPPG